ncbi:hypothetical protein IFT59_21850 [Rhizobium sp. CFBP 8752]|uniref:hypothetical protein n=1 Tax=Rhizobium sp. CFBP 8752 TaxID=2775301 RepID=UPI00178404BA|nr:hypothetical protein [Rhizobium sp. CFBP 8752]MBD8665892.1 hypothetical protein [Rhizobium sp. CFBP 8752]
MAPCILSSVDFHGGMIDTHTNARDPVAGAIRLDLSKDGRPITPANLAAALGVVAVRVAAEHLIDISAGRVSGNAGMSCSSIASEVFGQAEQYPLDRPDLRLPHERGPS